RVLSRSGCRIALTYRQSRKPVEEAVHELTSDGAEAIAFQCDLTKKPEVIKVASQIARHFKGLNILVNLSSIYEESEWEAHMKTNAESAYVLTAAVAPWMKKAGEGRVVHISDWTSASGRPRYKDFAPYYISKLAIKGVVESMALELAPKIL